MEISLIKPEDTLDFIAFYKKLTAETDYLLFSPDETEERAQMEESFIKNYNAFKQVFLARENGQIVGYLGIMHSHLSRITHVAKFTVGVLETHKRQKIATQLIETSEKWAREHDITRLELTVITIDEPAVELFRKTGFEEEGTRRQSVKIGNTYYDEYMMSKIL